MPLQDTLHVVLQTYSSAKFKQIFDIYTRSYPIADFALNHVRFRVLTLNPVWFRAAMHPKWCMVDCGLKNPR
jgi:hypothetical protein